MFGSTWREVESLIATKLPKNYDRAVNLMVDLRNLAARFKSVLPQGMQHEGQVGRIVLDYEDPQN